MKLIEWRKCPECKEMFFFYAPLVERLFGKWTNLYLDMWKCEFEAHHAECVGDRVMKNLGVKHGQA